MVHLVPKPIDCAKIHLRIAEEFIERAQAHIGHVFLDHRGDTVALADDIARAYTALTEASTLLKRLTDRSEGIAP